MTNEVSEFPQGPRDENLDERAKDNHAGALEYADEGFPVFLCKDGLTMRRGKTPDRGAITRNSFKDATTYKKRIRDWWHKHPRADPGIPTGTARGVAMFDLALKSGKDGVAAIRRLGFAPDQPPPPRTTLLRVA